MKGFCLYSVELQKYQPNLDYIILIDYDGEVNSSKNLLNTEQLYMQMLVNLERSLLSLVRTTVKVQ